MQLSIIVPIYNSEKYLEECIESIISQESKLEYEILLVNDGSTDGSKKISKKYATKYSNIIYLEEINSGVSSARNNGILNAHGKYIFFMDSDDVMSKNLLRKISPYFTKEYDMFFGNFTNWYPSIKKEFILNDISKIKPRSGNDFNVLCNQFIKRNWQIPWNTYQYFVKRDTLINKKILFNQNLTVGEDCDFFFRLIKNLHSYIITDFIFVKYRVETENSLIKSQNSQNILSQLKVFSSLYNQNGNDIIARQYYADRFANVFILIGLIRDINEKQECLLFVLNNKHILWATSKHLKYRVMRIMLNIFGLRITSLYLALLRNGFRKIKIRKNGYTL